MKLFFLLCPVIAASLCMLACDNDSSTSVQPKSCVVDMARLMRDSAPGKEGVKFIEARQQAMQKELDVINDKLEKNPDDAEAMQQLQQVYAASQQRIQAEGQNVASQVLDIVQRELNLYQKQNGYDYILFTDALAAYDPDLDKTNSIIDQINKQKFEIKELPQQASPDASSVNSTGKSQTAPAK